MTAPGLTRQSLVYLAAAAANAVVPFVVLPIFTRWLGPSGFGSMAAFLALINVLAILIGLGTYGKISVSYFREGPASLPLQTGAAVGVMAVTAVPVLLLVTFASAWIAARTGVPKEWLVAAWLCACGQFAIAVTAAVWQSRLEAWRYGATQVGYSILWATIAILLVGFAGMDWTGRALAQAIAAGVAIVVCLAILTEQRCIAWDPRHWPIKATLAFGIPLLPHTIGAVAMSTIDRFALKGTVGDVATGHYFAAFQIATLLSAGAAALNSAWMPWMYGRLAQSTACADREVMRATYAIWALLLGGSLVVALFAGRIVDVVAGPGYETSAALLRLLAPAAAFGGMYYFVTGYLFYAERTGVLSAITISVGATQVALTLWLVRRDGAHGVATAALVSSFLYCVITAVVANRIRPMPWLTSLFARTAPLPSPPTT